MIEFTVYRVSKPKSRDWIGIFLIGVNLALLAIVSFLPIIMIVLNLDPFYFIFEQILPEPYDGSVFRIILIPLVRIFMAIICIFEFLRYLSVILLVFVSISVTLVTCFRKLVQDANILERRTLVLYIQLRVILKTVDYIIRYVVVLLMTLVQVIIVSMSWFVLKCWHIH